MELDELKDAWQQLDTKLDRQYALDLHRLRGQKLVKVRLLVGTLVVGRALQLLAGVALNVLMVSFIADHLDQPHLVVDAVLLFLFGILMMMSSAREFQLVGAVDLAAPVLAIQKRLAALQRWHLIEALVFGLTGSLIWVPLTLVTFEIFFGIDLYLNAPKVVLSFVASALVCVALVCCIVAYAQHSARKNRWLDRHFSGKSLWQAQNTLEELARFEHGR